MKKIYFSILFCLMGCASQTVTLNNLKLVEPSLYKQFTSQKITVTCKDSVKVTLMNNITGVIYQKQRLLRERPIFNYYFSEDSLFVDDSGFSCNINISNISYIEFLGIYDDELGFISEEDLNNNIDRSNQYTSAIVLGGFTALAGGKLFLGLKSKNGFDAIGENFGLGLLGGALGATVGTVLGYHLVSKTPTLQEILLKMKNDKHKK